MKDSHLTKENKSQISIHAFSQTLVKRLLKFKRYAASGGRSGALFHIIMFFHSFLYFSHEKENYYKGAK